MAITIELKNYDGVIKGLWNCRKDLAKKASKAMISVGTREAKTAAQQQVRKVYNVSVADVNERFHYTESGGFTLDGVRIPFFTLEWEQDKPFTVAHKKFGMKPNKPMYGKGKSGVTFKPLKSGAIRVGSTTGYPAFVAIPKRGGGIQPFVRTQHDSWIKIGKDWHHTLIDMVPTHLSVPQMIDNEKVNPKIEADIVKRLEKALGSGR